MPKTKPERVEKVAKAILEQTKKMIDQLPNNFVWVRGKQTFTKKEIQEKFNSDDEFAVTVAESLAGLKFDVLIRKSKSKED